MAKIPFRPRPESESNLAYNQVLQNRLSETRESPTARPFNPAARMEFESALTRLETASPRNESMPSKMAEGRANEAIRQSDRKSVTPLVPVDSPLDSPEPKWVPGTVTEKVVEEELAGDLLSEVMIEADDSLFEASTKPHVVEGSIVENVSIEIEGSPSPLQNNSDVLSQDSGSSSTPPPPIRVETVAALWKHVSGMDARTTQKHWRFTLEQGHNPALDVTLLPAESDTWSVVIHVGAESNLRSNQGLDELKNALSARSDWVESITVTEEEVP